MLSTAPRIFKSQTKSQIFEIYDYPHDLPRTLKQFYDPQLFLPMGLEEGTLYFPSLSKELGRITIFPAFYSADRNATNHRVLIDFLDRDPCVRNWIYFSIYLNPSNMPTIHALARDSMAVRLFQTICLHLHFERRCEIVSSLIYPSISMTRAPNQKGVKPSQEMKEAFLFFSNLKKLNVIFRSPDGPLPEVML